MYLAFLDIEQASDRVWQDGLLYKLNLPSHIAISDEGSSTYYATKSGQPQNSELGPFLYLIFTVDIPKTRNTTVVTFADVTTIMAVN